MLGDSKLRVASAVCAPHMSTTQCNQYTTQPGRQHAAKSSPTLQPQAVQTSTPPACHGRQPISYKHVPQIASQQAARPSQLAIKLHQHHILLPSARLQTLWTLQQPRHTGSVSRQTHRCRPSGATDMHHFQHPCRPPAICVWPPNTPAVTCTLSTHTDTHLHQQAAS